LPHLNLAGSKINIEGDPLKVDKLRIYAQAFNGAFIKDSSDLPTDFQVGSYSPSAGTFTPYTSASQVGGIASQSGFVSTTAQLNSLAGSGVPCGANCPSGSIQIKANIEPYNNNEVSLRITGRETIFGPWTAANNITSGSVANFTPYLGGGIYQAVVSLPNSVTPTPTPTPNSDRDQKPRSTTSTAPSPSPAVRATSPAPAAPLATSAQAPAPAPAAPSASPPAAAAPAPAAQVPPAAAPPTALAPIAVKGVASAQVVASLEQSEQRNTEKVAVALGLSLQESTKAPSTVDIQNGLKAAIASVRTAAAKQAALGLDPGLGLLASAANNSQALLNPSFNRAVYNPAVLHLRYSNAAVGGFDAQLDLVLITATGEPKGIRVPLRQADFRDSLQKLYGALSRLENLAVNDANGPSRSLYRQIFASLEPILQEQKITTLLLSADQGLQAIPYAALHNGKQFLGEQYGLSLTPSLNLTNLQPPLGRGGDLLALGASRFDGLAPLPLVPEELRAVSIGQKSEIFLDQAFTPSSLLISAADPRFRRVHVATHAEFLPGGPSQSRIYTGTTAVALKEFASLRSRRADASLDLISLSACRTAIGDADSELGFAGLALQAGARSAIGSLWYVDDVATSAFFVQTYRHLEAGVPKAEALQLTRQAFSRGLIRLEADRVVGASGEILLAGLDASQRRIAASGLTHPYFWGGIQLMGSPW